MRNIRTALAAGSFALVAGMAQAAPLTWYFDDLTFADGAVGTGSFVFDSAISGSPTQSQYSAIDLTITGGTALSDATYNGFSATSSGNSTFMLFTIGGDISAGAPVFRGQLDGDLTDAGGAYDFVPHLSAEGNCITSSFECGAVSVVKFVASGGVTTTAPVTGQVPLPAGLPLLLAGLGAVFGLRRRRG